MGDTITKTIDVVTKDKSSAALKGIAKEFDGVATSANNVNKASSNLSTGLSGIVTKMVPLAAGVVTVSAAYGKLTELFKSSIAEFKEGELSQTRLKTALGFTSQSLLDYADSLQKVTMYSDDELVAAQAQFAMYTKDEQQINKLTKAATDLAAAKGIDLTTATNLLTRSIGTGTNVLARYGVQMKDTTDITERIDSVTASATNRFKNMAEELGKTKTGQVTILTNEVNGYKEALGKELLKNQEDWNNLVLTAARVAIPTLTGALKGLRETKQRLMGATSEELQFEIDVDQVYKDSPVGVRLLSDEITRLYEKRQKLEKQYESQKKTNPYAGGMSYMRDQINSITRMIDLAQNTINDLEANRSGKVLAKNESVDTTEQGKEIYKKQEEERKKAREDAQKENERILDQIVRDIDESLQKSKQYYIDYEKDKIDGELEAAKEELKILEDNAEKHKDFAQRKLELEIRNRDISRQGQLENLNVVSRIELDNIEQLYQQKIISEQEFQEYLLQLEISYKQQKRDINLQFANEAINAASTVASSMSSIQSLYFEGVNRDADKKAKKDREHAIATIKNKKQLDAELAKIDAEAEARAEEQYKQQKKMALIMSIIQTAQAVTGALSMMPPPVGIAMAVIVGALGAIQTGIIASQAFAQGGIVQAAGAPSTGDKVNARLNPGEMVLNQTQKDNMLWNLATTRQRQEQPLAVGGDTYVVQGNLDTNAVKEIKKYKEEFLDVLRSSNKELAQRGYQYAY